MHTKALSTALLLGLLGHAPAGHAPAVEAPTLPTPQPAEALPAAAATAPDWFVVDEAARTVTITLVAGATQDNNYWNYNGLHGGAGEITVPEGFTVTLHFENRDPAMMHSVGVGERRSVYPVTFSDPQPAFAGAMSSNPTSLVDATSPGASETLTFVAERAGAFALICHTPGHAATGHSLKFTVSEDGSYGVRTATSDGAAHRHP